MVKEKKSMQNATVEPEPSQKVTTLTPPLISSCRLSVTSIKTAQENPRFLLLGKCRGYYHNGTVQSNLPAMNPKRHYLPLESLHQRKKTHEDALISIILGLDDV
jgi:hypothetical protein